MQCRPFAGIVTESMMNQSVSFNVRLSNLLLQVFVNPLLLQTLKWLILKLVNYSGENFEITLISEFLSPILCNKAVQKKKLCVFVNYPAEHSQRVRRGRFRGCGCWC